MSRLIKLFQSKDYEIHYGSTASASGYAEEIDEVKSSSVRVNDPAFDDYIKGLQPDVVLFDRFMTEEQFGWRVASLCPDAIRVLDTEDLHCLRYSRQAALESKRDWHPSDLFREIAYRELASIYRCDLNLVISRFEVDLLRDIFKVPEHLLCYLPFHSNGVAEGNPPYEDRLGFISIGNFRHAPNRDAVLVLKNELWPRIRKQLPRVELFVCGSYPSRADLQLDDPKNGFHIKGRVEDANAVINNARVLLAPLRFGAGQKGKLLQAMELRTPSVTTPIGSEAMHGDLPWPGVISTDMQKLADEAVLLHEDKDYWSEKSGLGASILKAVFDAKANEADMYTRLVEISSSVERYRQMNFIGQMLQFHGLKAHEYLSKWIMSKTSNS